MRKDQTYRFNYFIKCAVLLVGLLFIAISYKAMAQMPPSSSCSNTCGCTENYMYARDGDEQLPLDGQPGKEDGIDFKVIEVGPPAPNARASTSIAVVEQWSKTPEEILQLEFNRMNNGRKRVYEFITEGKGVGDTINQESLISLRPALVTGPFRGKARQIPYPVEGGWTLYTPDLYVLKLGTKNCFFETGFERSQMPGTWTELFPQWPPSNNPYLPRSILRACLPASWLRGNIQSQIQSYFFQKDYSTAVGIMEFIVGAAPFLGTADLIANQGVLTKVFKGDLESIGNFCGSVSGDLFIAAKALKAIRGAAGVAKIVQVGTFSTGAGSVVFTGGYLWSKASNDGLQPFDYGRAALLGLQIVGLLTDRESQTIIKGYVSSRYFSRKKPDIAPLACGPHCLQANKDATPIDLKKDLLPVASAASRCTTLACKAPPSAQVLDGMILKNIDELIAELPPEIVRRVEYNYMSTPTMANGKAKGYLADGWLNPADAGGMATPFNHIENPTKYSSKTPWISFSDTTVFPNGVQRFGDTTVFFRVRDFLNDLKKTANCGNVAILTNKQLATELREGVYNALSKIDKNKVNQLIAKLDELKLQYPLGAPQHQEVQTMLSNMGLSKTKVKEIERLTTAYMHQGANAEILFFGPVPESYLRILR